MPDSIQIAQRIKDESVQDAFGNQSTEYRAAHALLTFWPGYGHCSLEEGIQDLMADLRHLCDLADLNFSEISRKAYRDYAAEIKDLKPARHEELTAAIKADLT